MIPLGPHLPDLPPLANPGILEARNCLPGPSGYRPIRTLTPATSSLSDRCQGAVAVKDAAAAVFVYAGSADKLLKLSGTGWVDHSRAAAYTAIDDDEQWEFAQFDDYLLAANISNALQGIALGNASFSNHIVSGLQPQARHIAVVRDHVMLGNTVDSADGAVGYRLWWSGRRDSTDFSPSAATLADKRDLRGGGGSVMKLLGGQYGTIFTERSIWRATFTGGRTIFQLDELEQNSGAIASGSVAKHGSMVFYLSGDGFNLFQGTGSLPIGANKLDRTFFDDVDDSYLARITAAVDPLNTLYLCAYPSRAANNGRPDRVLAYNWATQDWSISEIEMDILIQALTVGYTMDNLDALSGNMDALTVQLDSRFYLGGATYLGAFDAQKRLATFEGAILTARFETGDYTFFPGQFSRVQKVRPVIDHTGASTLTLEMGARDRQDAAIAYAAAIGMEANGEFRPRSNALYHRFRLSIAGGFTKAHGLEILDVSPTGMAR